MLKLLKSLGVFTVLSIILATPLSLSVSAQTSSELGDVQRERIQLATENADESINIMVDNPAPGIEIIDISREEYVKNIAGNQGISYEEADLLVAERTAESLKSAQLERGAQAATERSIVWRQASWTQSYSRNSAFKADLNASFEVYVSGSFRQINSSTVGSSLAAGRHTATWQQSNSWKTTKYPVATATVGVTGKFYSKYGSSAGVSGGIPGFTVSGSTSSSVSYVSQSMTIEKLYSVY